MQCRISSKLIFSLNLIQTPGQAYREALLLKQVLTPISQEKSMRLEGIEDGSSVSPLHSSCLVEEDLSKPYIFLLFLSCGK